MNEKQLCSALTKALRTELKASVVFKHADRVTAGIPDISVTWGGRTTWLEVKYKRRGEQIEKGQQFHTCSLLADSGSCLYVVYQEEPKRTLMVYPNGLSELRPAQGHYAEGFKHSFVVEWIRSHHERYDERA